MVERHHQIDFATGALVFPGGKVDPSDYDPRLRAHARAGSELDDERFAIYVSAIRETFEEAGVPATSTSSPRSAPPTARASSRWRAP